MTKYVELVQSLNEHDILSKWKSIVPMKGITDTPRSAGSILSSEKVFEGHDEEQIKLMEELCIVLDYNDKPVGAGTKKLCHLMENINAGLLHRAFSVFLFNEDGKLLLQQRASEKITFPDMWTNTCCSHPLCVSSELGLASSEDNHDQNNLGTAVSGAKVAATRKLLHELGIPEEDCPSNNFNFLTRIHYKSASGDENSEWGEHEIDYILILRTKNDITVKANPNEVRDQKFVSEKELKEMFKDDSLVFTPWFKLICETFLFTWWGKLNSLEEFQDEKIHRML